MAFAYSVFDTTPANLVADLKTKILLSSDWSNPSGNVVKCTTPLGATMAIDLAGAAAVNTQTWTPYIYRTYATSSGVDQLTGYGITFKAQNTGTTTTIPLHVTLSAGNTLLYVQIEGPRAGETGADTSYGSIRQTIALSQITPYFAGDAVPQVAFMGGSHNPIADSVPVNFQSTYSRVGQNMAQTTPWVTAHLMALCFPQDAQQWATVMPNRGSDGSFYLSPYVVFEHLAGLRGRLTDVFFAGANRSVQAGDLFYQAHTVGDVLTIGGNTYTVIAPYRGVQTNSWNEGGAFGYYTNAGISDWGRSPLVAVRTA